MWKDIPVFHDRPNYQQKSYFLLFCPVFFLYPILLLCFVIPYITIRKNSAQSLVYFLYNPNTCVYITYGRHEIKKRLDLEYSIQYLVSTRKKKTFAINDGTMCIPFRFEIFYDRNLFHTCNMVTRDYFITRVTFFQFR